MMGFGATGPIVWLFGALAMIAIWGGVWWGLSALVFHWPARERTQPRRFPQPSTRQHPPLWLQPSFDPNSTGPETGPGRLHGAPQQDPILDDEPTAAQGDNR